MLTNEEFREVVKYLTSQEVGLRIAALKDLWQFPSADPRILPYLEHLLYDKAPCILGYPYVFGEVRWLAARALAAERAALGISEPVQLPSVVRPAETMDIMRAADAANFRLRGGVDGLVADLAILRDMGYMPMVALHLVPSVKPSAKQAPAIEPFHQPELVPA